MQKKKKKDVQQQRLVVSADARPADQHPRRYNRAEGFQEVAVPMDEEQVHQDIVLRRRADAEAPPPSRKSTKPTGRSRRSISSSFCRGVQTGGNRACDRRWPTGAATCGA